MPLASFLKNINLICLFLVIAGTYSSENPIISPEVFALSIIYFLLLYLATLSSINHSPATSGFVIAYHLTFSAQIVLIYLSPDIEMWALPNQFRIYQLNSYSVASALAYLDATILLIIIFANKIRNRFSLLSNISLFASIYNSIGLKLYVMISSLVRLASSFYGIGASAKEASSLSFIDTLFNEQIIVFYCSVGISTYFASRITRVKFDVYRRSSAWALKISLLISFVASIVQGSRGFLASIIINIVILIPFCVSTKSFYSIRLSPSRLALLFGLTVFSFITYIYGTAVRLGISFSSITLDSISSNSSSFAQLFFNISIARFQRFFQLAQVFQFIDNPTENYNVINLWYSILYNLRLLPYNESIMPLSTFFRYAFVNPNAISLHGDEWSLYGSLILPLGWLSLPISSIIIACIFFLYQNISTPIASSSRYLVKPALLMICASSQISLFYSGLLDAFPRILLTSSIILLLIFLLEPFLQIWVARTRLT